MENSSNLSLNDEATLKRILSHSTVEGIIITNDDGQLQYTSLDNNTAFIITSKLLSFALMARSTVRNIDPSDNLITCRLRTRQKEMMVVSPNDGMQVIAIQKFHSTKLIDRHKHDEYDENFKTLNE